MRRLKRWPVNKPCRVRAIYIPHLGVYMDDNLDIEHNEFDRSILLHELVHHAQAVMGKYEDLSLCENWKSSEIEAYRIQDMFLARVASAKRIPRGMTQALHVLEHLMFGEARPYWFFRHAMWRAALVLGSGMVHLSNVLAMSFPRRRE